MRFPLRWERAAGGPGTANPTGMALDAPPDTRGAVPIPNLLPPNLHVAGRRDVLPPAGFMPIAAWWPGRRDKLGPRATGWDPRRWSEVPLPDDVDAAYFNAAPADQQVPEIRAGERLVLENLHPDHPRLVTNLEAISLSAVAEVGGPNQEVRLRCDTLAIDTDRGTASLVWRGQVRLTHPSQPGRVVVTMERPGVPGLAAIHAKLGGTGAIDPAMLRGGEALPFGPGAAAPGTPVQAPVEQNRGDALPELAAAHKKFGGTAMIDPALVRQLLALPFQPAPSTPEPADALPELARAHAKFGGTMGVDPAAIQKGESLPFVPGAGGLVLEARPAEPKAEEDDALPELRAAHAKFGGTVGVDWVSVRREALPFGSPSPAPAPLSTPAQRAPEPALAVFEAVVPPPMIGPLATPEMSAKPEVAAVSAPVLEVVPPVADPAARADEPLPLDAYPLERCAAITASVARRKAEKVAILERHALTEEVWAGLEKHWAEAIQKELERGKKAMLDAFDSAYVAQLEDERGIVTVVEYARLIVATERGTEDSMLAELDLPRGALLRVQRVWLKKTAGSAALGRRVREAVEVAREG